MSPRLPIGVLISGGGTNLQAIIDAIESGALRAEIRIIFSNTSDAYGLVRAKRHSLPTAVLSHLDFETREAFDQAIVAVLKDNNVELVALAGFMRLLSPVFIRAFPQRILNIHPALLPAFPQRFIWLMSVWTTDLSSCRPPFQYIRMIHRTV